MMKCRRRYQQPATDVVVVRHEDVLYGRIISTQGISASDSDGTDVNTNTGASADESDAKSWLFSDWDDVPNTTAWDR